MFPVLRYRDAAAAIDWLHQAFGFEERGVYRDDNGTVVHAELALGDGMIMIGQYADAGWMGGKPPAVGHSQTSAAPLFSER